MTEKHEKANIGAANAPDELKSMISERAEKKRGELASAVGAFRDSFGRYLAERDPPKPQEREKQTAADAAKMRTGGPETVEYRAPQLVRMAESALIGAQNARQGERNTQTAAQNAQTGAENGRSARETGAGAVRRGRRPSREERLETIRRLADEVAEELPQRFFEKLNGGIALTDAEKLHPQSRPERPLLILGEYRLDPQLGRSIMLYGGSIMRTYPYLNADELKVELRRIVRHEFTHHIESLCGERGLEIEDEIELEAYKRSLSEGSDKR